MDPIDDFVRRHQRPAPSVTEHPMLLGATLRPLNEQAADLAGRCVDPRLPEALRAELSGNRLPILHEILIQCANALRKHPEITERTGVSADSCERTVKLDRANAQIIKTTGDVYEAAGDGVRMVAAEANELGRDALCRAHDFIADPGVEAERRLVVETTFAEAFQSYAESRDRQDRAAARLARIQDDARAQAQAAADRARSARVKGALADPTSRPADR